MKSSEIARRIEEQLDLLGMKKMEFYEKCDITRATFSQWKNEKAFPTKEKLDSVNAVLGLDFSVSVDNGDSHGSVPALLQNLRDEERALLQVTRGMTAEQVRKMTEFAKTMKGNK